MATGSRYARFKRWDRADKSDCVNSDRQKRSIVSALRSQKEKKRKKKKSSLSGFIIARLRYPRYTFYRSKFIGPRYFFMVQVVRAHLCKHYESKSPQLRAENSRRKRWKSHDLSFIFFFFFPSFLRFYGTIGTNREYSRFEFSRDLIPCYRDYYLDFFLYLWKCMKRVVYSDLRYGWIIRSNVNF